MYSLTPFLLAVSAFILPAIATDIGTNCDIVCTDIIVTGDTFEIIAERKGVTASQLAYVNPQIKDIRFILTGDPIYIPDSDCVAPELPPYVEPKATCSTIYTSYTYIVVSGDTLTIIANDKLGISLQALLDANPQIADPDMINIGDEINVPLCPMAKMKGRFVPKLDNRLYKGVVANGTGVITAAMNIAFD